MLECIVVCESELRFSLSEDLNGLIQETACVYDGLVAARFMRSLEADGFGVRLGREG